MNLEELSLLVQSFLSEAKSEYDQSIAQSREKLSPQAATHVPRILEYI